MDRAGQTAPKMRQFLSPALARTEAAELRGLTQTFIRSIGVLADNRTPCGAPMAVSQAHALMVLLEWPRAAEPPTQQELGRVLGIDKSNIARLCQRMERAGHLTQKRSASDGRARLLSLTSRGKQVAAGVERASRARFEQLITAIPQGARAHVLSALAMLNDAVVQSAENGRSPSRKARPHSARLISSPTKANKRGRLS
jgi:DNA-binding MarR family transcriptional regulator